MQLCPVCRYKQGYFRATMRPTYRCRRCGHEWDLLLRCQECGHPRWGNTVHLDACLGCGTHFDPAYVLDVGYAEQRERKRLLRSEFEAIDAAIEESELSHRLRREGWLRAGGVRTDGLLEVDGRIVDPSLPPPLSDKAQARQDIRSFLLNATQTVGMGILAIVTIPLVLGLWLGFFIFEVGQSIFALLFALCIVSAVVVVAIGLVGWVGIGFSDLLRIIWRRGSNQ